MVFEPRNFHFESTYPFNDPRIEEIIVAGIVSRMLFIKFLLRPRNPFSGIPAQAALKLSNWTASGRLHILLRSWTSTKDFNELDSITYTGTRKMIAVGRFLATPPKAP